MQSAYVGSLRIIADMYIQYKSVILNYKAFRKTAATTRAKFQDATIEELALAGDVEASSVRKRIKNMEMS